MWERDGVSGRKIEYLGTGWREWKKWICGSEMV